MKNSLTALESKVLTLPHLHRPTPPRFFGPKQAIKIPTKTPPSVVIRQKQAREIKIGLQPLNSVFPRRISWPTAKQRGNWRTSIRERCQQSTTRTSIPHMQVTTGKDRRAMMKLLQELLKHLKGKRLV